MSYKYGSGSGVGIGTQDRNSGVYTKTILGNTIRENPVPVATANIENHPLVAFQDSVTGEIIGISKERMSLGCLALAAPGGGKTNMFNIMLSRLLATQGDQDIIVVFDTKGDYWREFGSKNPSEDVILIGTGEAYRNRTSYHNIFAEVMPRGADGRLVYTEESDADVLEISTQLFQKMNSEMQPIFPAMAEQIFAGIMVYFMRTYWGTNQSMLNNKQLITFLRSATNEELMEIFEKPYMKDWRLCKNYISGKSNQTQGVNSYIGSVLMKMFIGPFTQADKSREFSMMHVLKESKKKVIFIEYDLQRGAVLAPMYGILIDQVLKHALGGREENRKNVYLLLDEMKILPKLIHASTSLSYGRSQGVKVMAGLQNISSLEEQYGEAGAKDMLAGFQNIFAFKITDYDTRQFLVNRLGENYQNLSFSAQNNNINVQRTGHTIEEWDILDLDIRKGRAVVSLAGEKPFLFNMPKY